MKHPLRCFNFAHRGEHNTLVVFRYGVVMHNFTFISCQRAGSRIISSTLCVGQNGGEPKDEPGMHSTMCVRVCSPSNTKKRSLSLPNGMKFLYVEIRENVISLFFPHRSIRLYAVYVIP